MEVKNEGKGKRNVVEVTKTGSELYIGLFSPGFLIKTDDDGTQKKERISSGVYLLEQCARVVWAKLITREKEKEIERIFRIFFHY